MGNVKTLRNIFIMMVTMLAVFTLLIFSSIQKNKWEWEDPITAYEYIDRDIFIPTPDPVQEEEIVEIIEEYIEDRIDNTAEIKISIENYLGSYTNNVSIYYYDLIDGYNFGINEEKEYFPASLSKLWAVITLYDIAHKGAINLNDKIVYRSIDFEGGAGILQGINKSEPFETKLLAEYAITHSDNIAYKMLSRHIGRSNLKQNYENIIGHEVSYTKNGTMAMSAKDAYNILKKVYDNPHNNVHYEKFVTDLKNNSSSRKINKYLPYPVARKGGSNGGYLHDSAIIYSSQPYILSVLTLNLPDPKNKIADIAKIIDDMRKIQVTN